MHDLRAPSETLIEPLAGTRTRTRSRTRPRFAFSGIALGSVGLLAILATAGSTACKRSTDKGDEEVEREVSGATDPNAVLAKIDNTIITVGEFEERIARQSPYVRGRYSSLEHKKEFLTNMIRFEVLALEAKRRGLDKDPDAVRAAKQVMTQKLMQQEFAKSITPESITDTELRAYYDSNANLYNKPEEVRVAAIVLRSRAIANKVGRLATGTQGATNKGFRDLVAAHSIDEEGRKTGGDLRYFSRQNKKIPKAVIDAAFALTKTGDVAGPIAGGGKFFIIKQTGKRKPVTKPFESVAEQIRNRLYREKRRDALRGFVSKLKAGADIKINEANLRKVKLPAAGATLNRSPGDDGHGHSAPPSTLPAMPATPTVTPDQPTP